MHFARTVVNPERAQFAEYQLNDSIASHTGATHDLDVSIRNPEQRFGHRHLRHGGLEGARGAAVEDSSAPVDHQLRLLQLDLIIGQHETDALMINEQLPEGLASDSVRGRDLLSAPARSEPT